MAGGGVGEAMLISAAVGGGTSMLTGKDPLEGALMGAVMGGAGAGLGAFGSAAGAGANAATTTGATLGAETAANAGMGSGLVPPPMASNALMPGLENAGLSLGGATPGQLTGQLGMPEPLSRYAADAGAQGAQLGRGITSPGITSQFAQQAAAPQSFLDKTSQYWNSRTGMQQLGLGAAGAGGAMVPQGIAGLPEEEEYKGALSKFRYDPAQFSHFSPSRFADGGIAAIQPPIMVPGPQDNYPQQAFAQGGVSSLGGYSDGGQLLKGPGDGVSDDIPASIEGAQPAALADGEFVVPARIVAELGNGSTDAGARQLYAMMKRVQQGALKRASQPGNIAIDSNAEQYLPA